MTPETLDTFELMLILQAAAVFAILYAVKGGIHGPALKWLQDRIPALKWPFPNWLLDGTQLSAIGLGIYTGNPLAIVAWWLAVMTSLGETIGNIGGYRGNWHRPLAAGGVMPYITSAEVKKARISGFKSGWKHGIFIGGLLALGFWSPLMVIGGALFPLVVWLCVSIMQFIKKQIVVSWFLYEPTYGAILGVFFILGNAFK